ncbi:Rad17 cell cycle checkpoint protein-domain-containing protein [Chlamydoabsidia padenii]|nr:Rad17 cell cycle checkpoint protein-domain-containing protein [Chlamydoabsidia padenii]
MRLSNLYNGPNFLLPSESSQKRVSRRSTSDLQPSTSLTPFDASLPWHEKYTPTQEDELAVRGKKLDEVKYFINHSAIARRPGEYRLLVLTGPTGVGKSTSIRVLSRCMGYDIIEWNNYQQQLFNQSGYFDPDYEPTIDKFSQFLHQAVHTTTTLNRQKPKIILLDDIPDLTTPIIRQKFQSLIQSYVQSKRTFLLVIVHSEAQMDTGFGRQNRYSSRETRLTTLNDIVSKDIRITNRCGIVEFNPIIKANLKPVLTRILKSETTSLEKPAIDTQQLDHIIEACHGDIRSAILTMQFYAARPSLHTRKRNLGGNLKDNSSIHGRQNHLEFFHAVGKVLYAKRTPSGSLESKPTNILNNLNTDTDRYLGILFSNHHKMISDIHDISTTMNYLCDADMIGGMGAWNDDVPLEYQLLISMHAIMATERKPSTSSRRPDFSCLGDGYYRPRGK